MNKIFESQSMRQMRGPILLHDAILWYLTLFHTLISNPNHCVFMWSISLSSYITYWIEMDSPKELLLPSCIELVGFMEKYLLKVFITTLQNWSCPFFNCFLACEVDLCQGLQLIIFLKFPFVPKFNNLFIESEVPLLNGRSINQSS